MAHRLHPAGIPTELSEHFVNYHVIPKPERRYPPRPDYTDVCCLRPQFVCLSKSSMDSTCVCDGQQYVQYCHPCPPVNTECCVKSCSKICCLPKPCLSSACCITKKHIPSCCGDNSRVIKITLPLGPDDTCLKEKMRRRMNKLKKDIQKYDEALACWEHMHQPCESLNVSYCRKTPKPCVPQLLNTHACCLKPKPCVSQILTSLPSCLKPKMCMSESLNPRFCIKKPETFEVCYAPVVCKQKQLCPPCSNKKVICTRVCGYMK